MQVNPSWFQMNRIITCYRKCSIDESGTFGARHLMKDSVFNLISSQRPYLRRLLGSEVEHGLEAGVSIRDDQKRSDTCCEADQRSLV